MNIGIITPTYNRQNLLKRLYISLEKQTDNNFTWIVVDDGSSDDTYSYINNLTASFDVRYFYKVNGGKVKALNLAFEKNKDIDLFLIVDSDDYLLENAIKIAKRYGLKYINNKNVGGIYFRYHYENGEIVGEGKKVNQDEVVLSRIEHDAIYDKVDGCISYFQKAVQKYRYPEFKDEKYTGPTVIQLMMSDTFKIAFTNEIIGVAEYQPGGLTNSGRKIRVQSPKSMLIYCHYMQDNTFDFFTKAKYGIMANAYYYIYKKNKKENLCSLLKLKIPKRYKCPGWILAKYWTRKYL